MSTTAQHPASTSQPDPGGRLLAFCKASADPLRLQVLRVLREDSFGVSELCTLFDIRQPALSHHLKILSGAGLVATRREGNSIFYRRTTPGRAGELEALQQQLLEAVDRIALPAESAERLATVYRQREENSRRFFRDNADKFRQQQDLIASYDLYAGTVAEVLRNAPLPRRATALEIGPGDGSFLKELAPVFDEVIALDIEQAMLDKATALAESSGLNNIQFLHGDTRHPALASLQADCIVINMVLHHTPDPGAVLADAAARLAPGGAVLVTDLCRHDQGWARESCGDLWLGFDPAELTDWAGAAGLEDIASEFLAQRNGFQVQVRLFGHH